MLKALLESWVFTSVNLVSLREFGFDVLLGF